MGEEREKGERERDTGGIEPEAGWYSLKGCAIYVCVCVYKCMYMGVEVSVGMSRSTFTQILNSSAILGYFYFT